MSMQPNAAEPLFKPGTIGLVSSAVDARNGRRSIAQGPISGPAPKVAQPSQISPRPAPAMPTVSEPVEESKASKEPAQAPAPAAAPVSAEPTTSRPAKPSKPATPVATPSAASNPLEAPPKPSAAPSTARAPKTPPSPSDSADKPHNARPAPALAAAAPAAPPSQPLDTSRPVTPEKPSAPRPQRRSVTPPKPAATMQPVSIAPAPAPTKPAQTALPAPARMPGSPMPPAPPVAAMDASAATLPPPGAPPMPSSSQYDKRHPDASLRVQSARTAVQEQQFAQQERAGQPAMAARGAPPKAVITLQAPKRPSKINFDLLSLQTRASSPTRASSAPLAVMDVQQPSDRLAPPAPVPPSAPWYQAPASPPSWSARDVHEARAPASASSETRTVRMLAAGRPSSPPPRRVPPARNSPTSTHHVVSTHSLATSTAMGPTSAAPAGSVRRELAAAGAPAPRSSGRAAQPKSLATSATALVPASAQAPATPSRVYVATDGREFMSPEAAKVASLADRLRRDIRQTRQQIATQKRVEASAGSTAIRRASATSRVSQSTGSKPASQRGSTTSQPATPTIAKPSPDKRYGPARVGSEWAAVLAPTSPGGNTLRELPSTRHAQRVERRLELRSRR